MLALIVAAGMNIFTYWNSDSMVLSMNDAQEVDESTAPEFYGMVRELAQRAGLPMPRVYLMQNDAAQRVRHRPQPAERRGLRDDRPSQHAHPR